MALAGSWARGDPHEDSDLDIVLLTNCTSYYVEATEWVLEIGGESIIGTRTWGVLTERRVRMPSGLEVDIGVVTPDWASTAPVETGTAAVCANGLIALHDPDGVLQRLIRAVSQA